MRHRLSPILARLLPVLPLLAPSAHAQVWEVCNLRDSLPGEAAGDQFGWVGRDAGDVDGDGVADVIIGAPGNDGNGIGAGRVYVYSGASASLLFSFDGGPNQSLGRSVGPAGDVNGDGFGDVIAGAPFAGPGGAGQAFILLGPAGAPHLTLVGPNSGDLFGREVNTAGDVDGDGFDDVIVGAPNDDTFATNAGRVYVFSGVDGALIRLHEGESAGANAGASVAGIHDTDHDGFADYLYGASGAAGGVGRAYVHNGFDGSQRCVLDSDATGANFGQFFVGWVGDVNADGTPDFFVSDWNNMALGPSTGRVFVYSGVDCSVIHTLTGTQANQGFGIGRGWVGDYDGDGYDDLFFGSWVSDEGGKDAGSGTLFSGATGERISRFTGNQVGATLGFDAAGLGDVDGDGWPDFLLTAASLSGNTGAAYILTGGRKLPLRYCDGALNSTGSSGKLEYRRSVSLTANEFRLRISQAIPNEVAIFFYGPMTATLPLGDGTLCVGSSLYRLGAVKLNASGARLFDVDFTSGSPSQGAGAITDGSSWYFQAWYRDPGGATGSNLTNGLRMTFCQ